MKFLAYFNQFSHWFSKKTLKIINIFLGILLVVYFMYLLFHQPGEVVTLLRQVKPTSIFKIFPVYVLATINASFLWSDIFKSLGSTLPISQHIYIYFATLAARRLPGPYMNVVGRIAFYSEQGISPIQTTLASAVELTFIIGTGVVVCIVGSINLFQPAKIILVAIVGILSVVILFSVSPILLRKLFVGKPVNLSFKKILLWGIGYTVQWVLGGFVLLFIVDSIPSNVRLSWYQTIFAWCVSGVGGNFFGILPSGLGVTEASMTAILSLYIPASAAVLASLISRFLLTVMDIMLSLPFLLAKNFFNLKGLLK